MIEADGIKVAENKEEAFWTEVKKKSDETIRQCNHEIVIQKAIGKLADDEVKKAVKR